MRCGVLCHRGAEKLCFKEVLEILPDIKTDSYESFDGFISFDIKSYNDIAKLTYFMRSAIRVLLLAFGGKFDGISDLCGKNLISDIPWMPDFISKNLKFSVVCDRNGIHNFKSTDIVERFGAIIKSYGSSTGHLLTPVFRNGEAHFFVYVIDDNFAFGLDFSGFDLSKRSYKVFGHQSSIRGTFGYSALIFGGFCYDDIVLCPFCQDGVLPIEATLKRTNVSVHRYDHSKFSFCKYIPFLDFNFDKFLENENRKKTSIFGFDPSFTHLQATQKNAKIAGIHKYAQFSKIDSDWLFTKFSDDKANLVACNLPESFMFRKDSVKKIYSDFFAELIDTIDEKSRVVIITQKPELVLKCAFEYKYEKTDELVVYSGKRKFVFLKLCIKKANVNKSK